MILASMLGWVVDVNRAFLLGEFKEDDPKIHMHIPEGIEKHYSHYKEPVCALLKKCLYGTK